MELYFHKEYPSNYAMGLNIVFLQNQIPVVIMTHLEENFISPIQNLVEKFASDIYQTRLKGRDPSEVVWVEHSPPYMSGENKDALIRVKLEWSGYRIPLSSKWVGRYTRPSWVKLDEKISDFVFSRVEFDRSRCAKRLGEHELSAKSERKMLVFDQMSVSMTVRDIVRMTEAVEFLCAQDLETDAVPLISAPAEIIKGHDSDWSSITWLNQEKKFGLRYGVVYWECCRESIGEVLKELN